MSINDSDLSEFDDFPSLFVRLTGILTFCTALESNNSRRPFQSHSRNNNTRTWSPENGNKLKYTPKTIKNPQKKSNIKKYITKKETTKIDNI